MFDHAELNHRFEARYNECTTLLDAIEGANVNAVFEPLFEAIFATAKELQSDTASLGDNIADAVAIDDASAWRRNIKFISQCFDRCIVRAADDSDYGRRHEVVARRALEVMEELCHRAQALWKRWAERPAVS